jgi:uncharacterized protein
MTASPETGVLRLLVHDLPQGHSRHAFRETARALDLESWLTARGPVEVDVDVERRGNQFAVRGTAAVGVEGECGRCTGEATARLEAELLVFSDLRGSDEPADEAALEGEGSILYHDGIELMLDDPVREALILEVPVVLWCRADCRGLSPTCGKNLNEGACGCSTRRSDPRWEALRRLDEKE